MRVGLSFWLNFTAALALAPHGSPSGPPQARGELCPLRAGGAGASFSGWDERPTPRPARGCLPVAVPAGECRGRPARLLLSSVCPLVPLPPRQRFLSAILWNPSLTPPKHIRLCSTRSTEGNWKGQQIRSCLSTVLQMLSTAI